MSSYKSYKRKKRSLLGIVVVVFAGVNAVKTLSKGDYYQGTISAVVFIVVGIIEFILRTKPFIKLSKDNLLIYQGLLKPTEYKLSNLEIQSINDTDIWFKDRATNTTYEISLSFLDNKVIPIFIKDFKQALADSQ